MFNIGTKPIAKLDESLKQQRLPRNASTRQTTSKCRGHAGYVAIPPQATAAATSSNLGNVGFLERKPVLRPPENVVDMVDVEAHVQELALHQAVPQLEERFLTPTEAEVRGEGRGSVTSGSGRGGAVAVYLPASRASVRSLRFVSTHLHHDVGDIHIYNSGETHQGSMHSQP